MNDPLALCRRWIAAVERNDGSAADFLADHAVQEEMPNRLFPKGRINDAAAIRANAERGRAVIASQRYEIVDAMVQGDRVALELAWTGTLAVGFGAIAAGSELRARVAMFVWVEGDKIVKLRNYDAYEAT